MQAYFLGACVVFGAAVLAFAGPLLVGLLRSNDWPKVLEAEEQRIRRERAASKQDG